jgi:S-adenosylmethionine/arginine decarboxylase-like enzyme
MSWGYHIMLDCSECDLEKIKNKDNILLFVETLVDRVNMKTHGDAIIENLLPGTDNEGYSVLQMITTSNVSCHFVNSTRDAYIDLFSCKFFETETVIATVNEFFKPTSLKINLIERQA